MPQFPQAGPFNPQDPFVLPGTGVVTPSQSYWLLSLSGQLGAIQTVVNNNLGTNFFTVASQPTLGVGDLGYVGFVTDFAHLVYWDGSAWQWLDGDRPLRFSDWAADPGTGWGLCDGSTYDYLVIGGVALTTGSFATPDAAGTALYKKSAAVYTGTVNPASGSTATENSHTHSGTTDQTPNTISFTHLGADGFGFSTTQHDHTFTTGAGTAHAHTVGSVDMPNVGVLPYVRL